jgi:hypothetical protein
MFERLARLEDIVILHTAFANAQNQTERSLLFKGDNHDSHALLPRTRKRRHNWPREILDICGEAIETIFLTRERGTMQETLNFAVRRIIEINLTRHDRGLDALCIPSRRLFERLLREIPAFDIYCARYGRRAAIVKFRSVKGHTITSAPLERAEIDPTPLDLFVVDKEAFIPLGRPYVTLSMAEDPNMLNTIMGRPLTRVLGHKGIEFEGLLYNSEALSELRNRYGVRLIVDIRVDDGNIGSIHVLYEGSVIQVPALKHSYADGISLWQHKVFQHQAAKAIRPAGSEGANLTDV